MFDVHPSESDEPDVAMPRIYLGDGTVRPYFSEATALRAWKELKRPAVYRAPGDDRRVTESEFVRVKGNPMGRKLSVPERHQLRIARDTLKLNDVGVSVLGGMTKPEARAVIKRLTGKTAKGNPRKIRRSSTKKSLVRVKKRKRTYKRNSGRPVKITKQEFYRGGGFANPKTFRVMRSGKWCYYKNR